MQRDHEVVSVEGLDERKRPGRPPVPFPAAPEQFLRDAIRTARYPSARAIRIAVREKAEALGLEAPTYDRVKRAHNAVPHAQPVAARHRKAAVIAHGTVHSAVREFRWLVQAGGAPDRPIGTLAKDLQTAVQADRRAVESGASLTGRLHRLVGDLTAYGRPISVIG